MSLIVKKQPWPKFLAKLTIVAVMLLTVTHAFIDRFRIGIDPQYDKCIPGYTFYLVDTKNKNVEVGKTFAFRAKGLDPLFKDGTWMVKFVRGMPGDTVEIDSKLYVSVNGSVLANGLPLLMRLQRSESDFIGKKILAENEHWMMGLSFTSFDSRYWGAINKEQVIGKAYPLF